MGRSLIDIIRLKPHDRHWEMMCRALWPEYYALYLEKYNSDSEQWIKNTIAAEIEFALALGQDNQLNGEDSKAIGTGAITRAFRELALGSYGLDTAANSATEWNPLDLLLVLMNGSDTDNRSNAIEAYKSGLVKLFNAIKLAKYEHGEEIPEDGILQFDEQKLQLWLDGIWKTILTDAPADTKPYGRKDGQWVEVAALDHDHEIGNQALLFENALI